MNLGIRINRITKGRFPMRVDSCRKCGEELQVMKLCSNCDQPLHFKCKNCNAFVEDPIHQHENFLQLLFQ